MLKRIIFSTCFLAAASAFAIFIPLQKDGSIRWSNDSQGKIESASPEEADKKAERTPAGNNNYGTDYIAPPVEPAPEEEPEPEYEKPAPEPEQPVYVPPKGYGDYACLKEGYKLSNMGDVSDKFIAMIALRQKGYHDTGFKLFTGKSARHKIGIKQSIFMLSSIGYCDKSDLPYRSGEKSRVTQMYNQNPLNLGSDDYSDIFGTSPDNVTPKSINEAKWFNDENSRIKYYWNKHAKGTPGQKCAKPLSAANRTKLCLNLYKACNAVLCSGPGCLSGKEFCKAQEREHESHGDSNNNPPGGDNHGSTTSHPGNKGEVGEGSNAEAGHHSDGSNNGGGQGKGPPGSN